jgi:UDP-N-acetylmuramoyl-L-alanyl-D-glutamate--2,6-diaminopimelate ligase
MNLRDLVASVDGHRQRADLLPSSPVSGVVQDHRLVEPGSVFITRIGAKVDAHDWLPAVADAGAVLAVGRGLNDPTGGRHGLPYLHTPDDRAAVACWAAAFHGQPARTVRVLGVTGTDGKTSTATLLWWLLQDDNTTALGSTALSRIGLHPAAAFSGFTTPEATDVQAFLAGARDAGAARVVMESSSHGLTLNRLDEIPFRTSVWTNLTPEHLDFHGSMEAYAGAKRTLFERSETAVLNADAAWLEAFSGAAQRDVLYGEHPLADWRILSIAEQPGGMQVQLGTPDGRTVPFHLPVVGRYNAWNAVGAIAAAVVETGRPAESFAERLATFPGVPGRMQVVQTSPFTVIVDFAHTPTALETMLEALPERSGELRVVIGAAGNRDPGKRRPLGETAARLADMTYFTEEDSRHEPVEAILDELVAGAHDAGGVEGVSYVAIADRREAIRAAVREARPGDVVVLCGKGHERTLERMNETLDWDEAAEAQAALKRGD